MSTSAWLAIVGGVGVLVFLAFGRKHKAAATSPVPPVRIVAFELVGTGLGAYDFLAALTASGRTATRTCLGLDRGIIAGYVLAFAGLGSSAVVAAGERASGGVEAVALAVAVVGIASGVIAGGLDLVENAALGSVLDQWADEADAMDPVARAQHRRDVARAMDPPAIRAKSAARAKFTLVAVGTMAIIGAWTIVYAAR